MATYLQALAYCKKQAVINKLSLPKDKWNTVRNRRDRQLKRLKKRFEYLEKTDPILTCMTVGKFKIYLNGECEFDYNVLFDLYPAMEVYSSFHTFLLAYEKLQKEMFGDKSET